MKFTEALMSAAQEVSANPKKPQLRGLHHATIKQNLIVGTALCVVSVVVMGWYNQQKKNDYAEFYKNYDANKSFEKMKNAGWFDSCK